MNGRRWLALDRLHRLRRFQQDLQAVELQACLGEETRAAEKLAAEEQALQRATGSKRSGAPGVPLDLDRYQYALEFEGAALARRDASEQAHEQARGAVEEARAKQQHLAAAAKAVERRRERLAEALRREAEMRASDQVAELLAGRRDRNDD